eukprot:746962-Hanusia_phi.AAC.8
MLGGRRKKKSAGSIPPTLRFDEQPLSYWLTCGYRVLCDSLLYLACFACLYLVLKHVDTPSKPKRVIRMDIFDIPEPDVSSNL